MNGWVLVLIGWCLIAGVVVYLIGRAIRYGETGEP